MVTAAGRPTGEERERADDGGPASTTVTPPTTEAVAPPGGGFRIEVPGSWVVGYPNAQGAPLADQMVPDRPDDADHIALVEAALVAPDTRMVALDPAGLGDPCTARPARRRRRRRSRLTAASTDELVELPS